MSWLAGLKKIFCVPLCAELHEGVANIRALQNKTKPTVKGRAKTSIGSLMATMAADLVAVIDQRCLLVLDAYFAVGPVFDILQQVVDSKKRRLVHIVTRAKEMWLAMTILRKKPAFAEGREFTVLSTT